MHSVLIKSKPLIHLLFLFLHLGAAYATDLSTLQLVQIISRHGDRAPLFPYPNDLYKNSSVYSLNGWGELTEIGEEQHYELGSFLRQRYDGFLPRKYSKKDFHIVSSDVDRTIISAESNVAGLYKRDAPALITRQALFNEWQPVPVHTIPQESDNFINFKAKCPRYNSLVDEYYNSEEVTSLDTEYKNFFDFASENSGAELLNLLDAVQLQDSLRCQRKHNLTLPTWVNDTVYDQLQFCRAISFTWNVGTDEMKRLQAGPLIEKLVENMQAKMGTTTTAALKVEIDNEPFPPRKDDSAKRKMYIYSGHDSTIAVLLHTLNLFEPHVIEYAAALLIELHKNPDTGEFFIELHYRNDTTKEPYKLDTTALCGVPCAFNNFNDFALKYIPTNWNEECQPLNSSASFSNIFTNIILALSVLILSLFMFVIIRRYCSQKMTAGEASRLSVNSYQKLG
ncbi:unnamed protein product [Orchesella dallaii]|uniref:acid phosphatase n=1 Tax=Orchesella dallaii TaxID=48710 RepID=A0ABP1RRU7_9HEXA